MSELKVNTIQPATGSQVTVAAQVLGVPGTDPNHFATVSQLGAGGAGGISRAQAQEIADIAAASAIRHSDEQDQLQNTQIALDIATAKTQAITEANLISNTYTDTQLPAAVLQANLYTQEYSNSITKIGATVIINSVGPYDSTVPDSSNIPSGWNIVNGVGTGTFTITLPEKSGLWKGSLGHRSANGAFDPYPLVIDATVSTFTSTTTGLQAPEQGWTISLTRWA